MRGGYRVGAGRPKGSRNKRSMMIEAAASEAAAAGITPLEYLLAVMRDEGQPQEVRMEAAKAALPYCAPRLAAVRFDDGHGGRSHADWVRLLAEEDSPI